MLRNFAALRQVFWECISLNIQKLGSYKTPKCCSLSTRSFKPHQVEVCTYDVMWYRVHLWQPPEKVTAINNSSLSAFYRGDNDGTAACDVEDDLIFHFEFSSEITLVQNASGPRMHAATSNLSLSLSSSGRMKKRDENEDNVNAKK